MMGTSQWTDLGDLLFKHTSSHSFMIERPAYGKVHRWVVRTRKDGRIIHEGISNGLTRAKNDIKPYIKQYTPKFPRLKRAGKKSLFMKDGTPHG